jgi:integrase
VTANRVRASLSAMFTRAMMQGRAASNPAALTVKHREPSRKRVLSNVEIAVIWHALDDDDYGRIVGLLTLTGARLNEIGGLRWSEITDNAIVLPAERVKNGNEHEIYLAPATRAILKSQPRRYNADGKLRDFVFGEGAHGFSSWTENKKALDTAIAKKGNALPHWTHHDLRRSAATRMAEDLKILPHVIEAVLNHLSGYKGGIAGIYNKASYSLEKKQALTLWAEHVTAIVEGRKSKVVPLRQPA